MGTIKESSFNTFTAGHLKADHNHMMRLEAQVIKGAIQIGVFWCWQY
jgi:hypothetical protein